MYRARSDGILQAEGIQKVMEAKAEGMERLFESCKGHPELAKFYLGVDSGLYKHVADASARAVQDLKPNITQWHTGPQAGTNPLVEMVQGMVPLYEQVRDHLQVTKDTDSKDNNRE